MWVIPPKALKLHFPQRLVEAVSQKAQYAGQQAVKAILVSVGGGRPI